MCGIAGRLNFDGSPVGAELLLRMTGQIAHRGPDDEGFYASGGVGLGMRRLSIIDVAGGHQPQCNEDGSIWIIFNGEIYNFPELFRELSGRGHRFKTRSDTEAIVHLYEEMGERCVTRLNGMFAFAIWDEPRQRLLLARDRLGKKPIVYALSGKRLAFASEIQALLCDPDVERRLDSVALQEYLRLWYVPSPRTMFADIRKLPPAHLLICEGGRTRLERYWDVSFAEKRAQSEDAWREEVMALLDDAVRIRLMSDVPLGALLSGGLDSSAVVALMAKHSTRAVKTFSIGFADQSFDELPHARVIARHFGTEHHEEVVEPDAAAVLPQLARHYGEPFGDDSSIPTYLVSRMARRHVTVALGGDGGDENFGGYPRLTEFLAFNGADSLRGMLAGGARSARRNPRVLLEGGRWRAFAREAAFRLREIGDPLERYANRWTVWKNGVSDPLLPEARAAADAADVLGGLRRRWEGARAPDPLDRLLYLELVTYLPDDLQAKIDIASMAASLEVRAPFLDYRLVELAARMPSDLKFRDGQTKVLLRRALAPLLPAETLARGKQGFSVPIARWLREDLRPMLQDLLLRGPIRSRGLFDAAVLSRLVADHLAGTADHGRKLWLLLNFEIWAEEMLDPAPVVATHD